MSGAVGPFPLVLNNSSNSQLSQIQADTTTSKTAAVARKLRLFHQLPPCAATHVFGFLRTREMFSTLTTNINTKLWALETAIPANVSSLDLHSRHKVPTLNALVPLFPLLQTLKMPLFKDLVELQKFQKLNLFRLTGPGLVNLAFLEHCPWIKQIDLRHVTIEGGSLTALSKCPQLSSCSFSTTYVTDEGLGSLGMCQNLETLILFNAFLMEGKALAGLMNSPNFSKLHILGKSGITNANLAVLTRLPRLSELALPLGFGITSAILPILSDCQSLSMLTLRELPTYLEYGSEHELGQDEAAPLIDDDLAVLEHYPSLKSLKLIDVSQITGIGLKYLEKCKQLSSLTLCTTKNMDNYFAGLRSLEGCSLLKHLKLMNMALTDADLLALAALQRLETLELVYAPNITQAGVDALQARCPNLKIIFPR